MWIAEIRSQQLLIRNFLFVTLRSKRHAIFNYDFQQP